MSVYGYPDSPTILEDSSNYEIVELHQGNHELYAPQPDIWGAFPFQRYTEDSLKFFRYQRTDTSGTSTVQISISTGEYQPTIFRVFRLKKGTGLLNVTEEEMGMYSSMNARYHMREFRPSYPDAHLTLPEPCVTLRGLHGNEIDTLLTIRNDGLQPLQISTISIIEPRFSIIDPPTVIDPLSTGTIHIHFMSSRPDTIDVFLIIQSNSTTSPDTLLLRGEAIAGAVLSLSAPSVYFGDILGGTVRSLSLTLSNTGNLPLTIDSIRMVDTVFSVEGTPATIDPLQSAPLYFMFRAPMTSREWVDTAFIYSNALNTPSRVVLRAVSVLPVHVDPSPVYVDFGMIQVNSRKDSVITVSNPLNAEIGFTRMFLHPSSAFQFLNQVPPDYIQPYQVFRDTIRFAPVREGEYSDSILYQTFNMGIITHTDTVVLSGRTPNLPITSALYQNYPNPFNPITTIEFDIAEPGFVTLHVFDVLGREIINLVNGNMGPGRYYARFDGSGFAGGIYFYQLRNNDFYQTRKFLLLR